MRDLRKYSSQTTVRLVIGFILILFIVGDGLIFLIYGSSAALSGFLCIGVGLIPLALIGLVFIVIDLVVKWANRDE